MYIDEALRKNNNFDVIRLAASIIVIFSHCFDLLVNFKSEPLRQLTQKNITLGVVCVYVFFIISGFLIAKSAQESVDITQYIKKRVLRIFPAFFWLIMLTYLIIGPALTTLEVGKYFLNQGSLDYLNNILIYPLNLSIPSILQLNPYPNIINGSIWTIRVEFTFYMILIPLIWLGVKKFGRVIFILISIFLFYIQSMLPNSVQLNNLILLTLPSLETLIPLSLFFILGSSCYYFRDKIILHPLVFLISIYGIIYSLNPNNGVHNFILILAPSLTYATLFIALYFKNSVYNTKKLGDYSYGIYLWGFPMQQLIIYFFHVDQIWILFISTVILAFVCAFLSWRYVEKPALNYK